MSTIDPSFSNHEPHNLRSITSPAESGVGLTPTRTTEQLSLETKTTLLKSMIRIRAVEETIAARYNEGKMRCPTHLSTGQEAVAAAVGLALRKDDFAVSSHRAHAHYMGKGGSIPRMMAEIYGKKTGCSQGKGGSMHLIDQSVGFMGSTAIVGGTIPVGVGLGLSIQLKNTDQVSCVYLGDGAVEEGAFYEAANFAVLRKLPVLFLCENNFYSVYSPLRVRQPNGRKIHELARAIGLTVDTGDGNDVKEVFQKTSAALDFIRAKNGPVFLEFTTYRWREHCGPNFDNNIGYRTEDEYLEWRAKEPIARFANELTQNAALSPANVQQFEADIQAEVNEAFDFADRSPFPDANEVGMHVWAHSQTRGQGAQR